jgi:hypothetical protein
MKKEPPSGSAVSVPPASWARICCVRSAMRAERSLGSASASSNAFVWIDCASADRRQRLDSHPRDVVLGLLGGQCRAAGLRVEPERLRLRVLDAEALSHDPRPEPPRCSELRHLLEEVVVGVEEERKPLAELVRRKARIDGRLAVGDSIREREGELLNRCRSGLADVVTGDRDRVPARQPLGAVGEQIGGQPHRGPRREDVVAAGDVLLEDVVLHGAAQALAAHALLLGDELVEKEQQRSRRVDRHRSRDLAEWDPVEEQRHVGDRVDRHAGPADLPHRALVIRVVAELGRQVERDGDPVLAAGEQVAEPRVRLLG